MKTTITPLALIAVLAGCPSTEDTGSSTTDGPEFSLITGEFGDGMLLSGFLDQGSLIMVGGDLDGGDGMIARYDGDSLCVENEAPTDKAIWWIHGDGDGEWFAVGADGLILHEKDGVRVREDVETTATFFGVWMSSEDEVWAVGGSIAGGTGEIWKRTTADGWQSVKSDLDGIVFKVWENWFVGVESSYHLESGSLVAYPTDARLTTVRGYADDDVYAIGGSSSVALQHFDGAAWNDIDLDGDWGVGAGLWTEPGADVWLAGTSGFMGYYNDGALVTPDFPLTNNTFHAVWPFQDEMIFIGGNFLTSGTDYFSMLGRYGSGEKLLTAEICQ
jgi:hypothetical protein